tara:strand:- start:2536 stop:3747 length:1212 start_codon:yes stop_codon:yes gene_type:complete
MVSNPKPLPYGKQTIDEEDINAVVSVLRSDWLTTGPNIELFEKAIINWTGAKFAVACSSGTAALHLAYMAAGLNHSNSLIVPTNTFMATANAARHTGAEVLFADVECTSGLMLVEHASDAFELSVEAPPKAIVPVHFAGQAADPEGFRRFADENKLIVIEDGSHALGSSYDCNAETFRVGGCAHSDMTTFSFHPVKTITTGEGGCVTTNDPKLAKKMRQLRNHGISSDPHDFQNTSLAISDGHELNPWYHEMTSLGLNYRASDIHCALGITQLARLSEFITRRSELVKHYQYLLNDLELPIRFIREVQDCQTAWHLAPVLIDFEAIGKTRAALMNYLKDNGITTQVHYIPVPYQPYYQKRRSQTDLPGTRSYYNQCLSLPLFPRMEMDDINLVVRKLAAAISG